jgi:uncharacterized secreted protein with C-terminal beta-propeller domain
MKKNYKIILPIIFVITLAICLIVINNKNNIKSIKSEHQLYEFYQNRYNSELTTLERILTLPFSLIVDNRSFSKGYRYYEYNFVEVDEAIPDGYSADASSASKDYSKTNIQVEGVDEADIIKTDGDFIYSISENKVIITNVTDPNDTKIESRIYENNYIPEDLLLYKNMLVVVSSERARISSSRRYNWGRIESNTIVTIYDVSDKSNPKEKKSFKLNSHYKTIRCIDGKLYVFTSDYLRTENKKVQREYIEDNQTKEIKVTDIKYLKDNYSDCLTLITELDLNNVKKDIKLTPFLIDIENAYISKNNIYLLDSGYSYSSSNTPRIRDLFGPKGVFGLFQDFDDDYSQKTTIFKFNINKNKGVEYQTTNKVKGTIINQYSLDEKDNNLRIALYTWEGSYVEVLDKDLKEIGKSNKLAKGENMYASRFMGDKAYLVTYKNTDPLFVIDLKDPKNPKVLGELKIPGYSTYLHPYDENHLIGIGMDTEEVINRDSSGKVISTWVKTNGMKMALFDVSDVNNPKEISKTKIGNSRTVSSILTNPKALLFSKEKNLIAIPVNNYKEDFSVKYSDEYDTQINNYKKYSNKYIAEGYFVYNLDLKNGFKLKGVINHEKSYNYYYYENSKLLRGIYINNDLYTVSEDYIKVNSLDTLKEISSLKIKE